MSYDWATADYLTDALDSAERRAYAAETALAEGGYEVESTGMKAVKSVFGKLLIMGSAGGTAYAAHTLFEKDGKPHMPQVFGVPGDLIGGFGLGLLSFLGFGRRVGLGHAFDAGLDKLSDGMFAHSAVVFGQRHGANAIAAGVAGTAGVAGAQTAGCGDAQVSAASQPPAMGHGSPADYMTEAQKAAWHRYAPAA